MLSTQARAGGASGGAGGDGALERIAEDISRRLPAEFDLEVAQVLYLCMAVLHYTFVCLFLCSG